MVQCQNGVFGTIEATRNAWGRNNYITFEIHGTEGSLFFNYERRDELQVCFAKDGDTEELFLAAVRDTKFAGFKEGVKATIALLREAS